MALSVDIFLREEVDRNAVLQEVLGIGILLNKNEEPLTPANVEEGVKDIISSRSSILSFEVFGFNNECRKSYTSPTVAGAGSDSPDSFAVESAFRHRPEHDAEKVMQLRELLDFRHQTRNRLFSVVCKAPAVADEQRDFDRCRWVAQQTYDELKQDNWFMECHHVKDKESLVVINTLVRTLLWIDLDNADDEILVEALIRAVKDVKGVSVILTAPHGSDANGREQSPLKRLEMKLGIQDSVY